MKRPEASRRTPGTARRWGGGAGHEVLETFVHDVANPLAVIGFSARALRSSNLLTERELADVRRTEQAAALVGQLVERLAASPEALMESGEKSGSDADGKIDLYVICCELAARRRTDGHAIHCRAFGDPRGRWDPRGVTRIVSQVLDWTLANLDGRSTVNLSVTGMQRHLRLHVHALGHLNPRRRRAFLAFPGTLRSLLGGTLTATVSPSGGVFTLRLPR